MEEPGRKRVLIIDDHPLLCDAVMRAINLEPDMMGCGNAPNASSGLDAIEELKPDIVLVDLSLGDASGFYLLQNIQAKYPKLPALVLSMHDEMTYAGRAIRAGAQGYIMKKEDIDKIVEAVRHVLSGKVWVSDKVRPTLLDFFLGRAPDAERIEALLSKRELQVFEHIGKGLSTEQIAQKMFISRRTVESHRDHIKKKLNVDDVINLQHKAFQWVQNELAP